MKDEKREGAGGVTSSSGVPSFLLPPSSFLLSARGVTKRFGAFTALDNVDFGVGAGEIHALLGENGAGKSTLMNLLSGLLRPSSGDILLDGEPARWASPTDAARAGVGMVHQHFLLVPTLSVAENLMLGASGEMGGALSYPLKAVLDEARALADRLGWRIPWSAPAGSLPVGTQQRVEILKALRGETRVLIFDEPTAVLTPNETPELFETIRRLANEGRGVVFISHKLDEVLSLAQTVTVLRRGRVVLSTTTRDTPTAAELAQAMVGADSDAAQMLEAQAAREAGGKGVGCWVLGVGDPTQAVDDAATSLPNAPPLLKAEASSPIPNTQHPTPLPPVLSVENLTVNAGAGGGRALLENVSFAVAAGEILGIAGVDGNGQAELGECLAGLLRAQTGRIVVGGAAPAHGAGAFRRAGVAVIPADRQTRGLALPLTITENLALGVQDEPSFRRGPLLAWPRLRTRAEKLIREFDIRADGPDARAGSLSGGNQQKIVIARALSGSPRVVVAVNPTRGLDVGAISYVHDALRRAQARGAAIVLISTELSEILTLADRVAVLFEGRLSSPVSPQIGRETLGLLMGGATVEHGNVAA